MKSRASVLLVGVGGVLLAGFIVSAILLFHGISRFNKAQQDLGRQVKSLENYYRRKPFPSPENAEKERANIARLDGAYRQLNAALRAGQIEPRQITPSAFMALYGKMKKALKDLAEAAGTERPREFAYGFDRYSASGALPAPADVPRLTQQLRVISTVCRLLFEQRVVHVKRIERDLFEDAAAQESEEAPSGRTGRFRRPRPGSASSDTGSRYNKEAGLIAEGELYGRLHFTLEFVAREHTLLHILSELGAHPMFAVVTRLELVKVEDDVAQITVGQDDAVDAALLPAASAKEVPRRRDRLISGPGMEVPMNVHLEFDVYRFAELSAAKGT